MISVTLYQAGVGVAKVFDRGDHQLVQLRSMEDVGRVYGMLGGNSGRISGRRAELIGTNFLSISL